MSRLKQLTSSLGGWLYRAIVSPVKTVLTALWKWPTGFVISIVLLLITVSVLYDREWAGLGDYVNSQGEVVPAKTLWDWLDLLIVPLILALGGILINSTIRRAENDRSEAQTKSERERAEREARTDRKIADDSVKEQALQAYFDTMTELLLKHGLREKLKAGERHTPVVDIARVRTTTALRKLDLGRKIEVLNFLRDSELYEGDNALLQGAIMNDVDLHSTPLLKINLGQAELRSADLTDAIMWKADLSGADLMEADLSGGILTKANLSGAHFWNARMSYMLLGGADLSGANLAGANLKNAVLEGEDPTTRKSEVTLFDTNTTLPDGTKWQPHMDIEYLRRFTDPQHPEFKEYKTIWDK